MNHGRHEKKRLVPKLRFPEFRDSETWICKSLKEILIFTDRKVKKPNKPYTRLGIRSHGKGTFLVFNELPEKNAMDYLYEVKLNDLIVNITFAWEGAIAIVSKNDEGALVSHRFPTYVFNESEAIPDFFQYLIIEKYFIYKLGVISPGGAGRNRVLSKTDFLKLKVNIPKIPEQQKIADCLISLDELITAEAGKLEAYKAHKKGLMQKLFPAEGETLPEWRFPGFRGKGAWELRELGGFITERNQFPKESVSLFSLTIEDGITPKTERYERSFLVNDEVDAYKLVLPDDFAYNPMNLRFGAIGRHSGTENVAVSKYYNIFFCDKTVDSIFCEIYFKSDRMIAFYDNMAIGSLIEKRRVHFSEFLKFNIRFPLLSEQQEIADCLLSLDALITAQAEKIDALKAHKRGLMQGLFLEAEKI